MFFRYLNDFEQKIPRNEIIEVEKIIKETLYNLDPKYKVTICGSFRLVVNLLKINNDPLIIDKYVKLFFKLDKLYTLFVYFIDVVKNTVGTLTL